MTVALKEFPLKLSSLQHGVRYSTTITVGKNGQESRNANWQDALRRYNASFAIKTQADVDLILAFFHVCRGRQTAFLLKDFAEFKYDFQAIQGIYPPDGVKTQFQMFRGYFDLLGNFVLRNTTKPKKTTVAVKLNGTLQTENTNYTVDYSSGIIRFSQAPAAGSTIEQRCEFFTPVRFDSDELDVDLINYWIEFQSGNERTLYQIPDIPLVEVRE